MPSAAERIDAIQEPIGCGPQARRGACRLQDSAGVVLALPRGGVPVVAEVASALDAQLDVILVRKIGVPAQPELAMGAVVDGGSPLIVRNEGVIMLAGISDTEFSAACDDELAEIERRRRLYLGDRERVDIADRVTRHRRRHCRRRHHPRGAARDPSAQTKKLVLAVPVAHISCRSHRIDPDQCGHWIRGDDASLKLTLPEVEQAAIWATGDVLAKSDHPLAGVTWDIVDILTADEEEPPPIR